jgi:hypothetical protein
MPPFRNAIAGQGKRMAHSDNSKRRQFNRAVDRMLAELDLSAHTGAGFPVDQILREFFGSANNRFRQGGADALPVSWVVIERFTKYQQDPDWFQLRPERDHLFDLVDFLVFSASDVAPKSLAEATMRMAEGVIYNFTPAGEWAKTSSFDAGDGLRLALCGASFVRRGGEVAILAVGGQVCDLEEKTAELLNMYRDMIDYATPLRPGVPNMDLDRIRAGQSHMEFAVVEGWRRLLEEWCYQLGLRVPERRRTRVGAFLCSEQGFLCGEPPTGFFICDCPGIRATPVQGTDNIWQHVTLTLIDTVRKTAQVKYLYEDHGRTYSIHTDDPEYYAAILRDHPPTSEAAGTVHDAAADPTEMDIYKRAMEKFDLFSPLMNLVMMSLMLPAYFEYRRPVVQQLNVKTALDAKRQDRSVRKQMDLLPVPLRPLTRRVAATQRMPITDTLLQELGRKGEDAGDLRTYTPPAFAVSVGGEAGGFWRRLKYPDHFGKDGEGNPVQGWTWVKAHLRWRDRPMPPPAVHIKTPLSAGYFDVSVDSDGT